MITMSCCNRKLATCHTRCVVLTSRLRQINSLKSGSLTSIVQWSSVVIKSQICGRVWVIFSLLRYLVLSANTFSSIGSICFLIDDCLFRYNWWTMRKSIFWIPNRCANLFFEYVIAELSVAKMTCERHACIIKLNLLICASILQLFVYFVQHCCNASTNKRIRAIVTVITVDEIVFYYAQDAKAVSLLSRQDNHYHSNKRKACSAKTEKHAPSGKHSFRLWTSYGLTAPVIR